MGGSKPTRQEQYEAFKAAFDKCLDALQIRGMWDISMELLPKTSGDYQASCTIDPDTKAVRVRFSHIEKDTTAERVARHETAHILVGDLAGLGTKRFVSEEELTRSEERVCNILEKILP
jgi:hypothetical protein